MNGYGNFMKILNNGLGAPDVFHFVREFFINFIIM